jgi:ketosteroid isomerase-like protein
VSDLNVRRVREAYDALSREDVDPVLELLHEDVEFRNPEYAMEPGTRHGREGFPDGDGNGVGGDRDPRVRHRAIVDAGQVIVVVGRFSGRGRGGGVPLDQTFGHVLEIRDGKAVSVAWFQEPAEAFATAGLSPS